MRRLGAHKVGPGIPSARRLGWLAVLMMLAVALLGPGAASVAGHTDTAGNNGTVKIHDGPNEPKSETRNMPHVCTFHIHFFFGDAHQKGNWEIQVWPPSSPKGTVAMRGTYNDTDGDRNDREPDSGAYSLPNGHYKLFWDGDTDKHDKMKVFWVKCPSSESTPTPTPTQGGGGGGGGSTPTPTPTPTQGGGGGGGGATPTPTPTHGGGGGGGGATPTPTPTPGGGGGGGGATPTPTPGGGGGGGGATPTPTPGGGGGGVVGTPTPSPAGQGGVGGATGTPNVSTTLPPTDTLSTDTQSTSDGWRTVLIAMAALLATALLLTPARAPARRIIRRR